MIMAEVLQQLADSLQEVRAALVLVTTVANLQEDMPAQNSLMCAGPINWLAGITMTLCELSIRNLRLKTGAQTDVLVAQARPGAAHNAAQLQGCTLPAPDHRQLL